MSALVVAEEHASVVVLLLITWDSLSDTGVELVDFRGAQSPLDPPLVIEGMLTKRRMRSYVASLKLTRHPSQQTMGGVWERGEKLQLHGV